MKRGGMSPVYTGAVGTLIIRLECSSCDNHFACVGRSFYKVFQDDNIH